MQLSSRLEAQAAAAARTAETAERTQASEQALQQRLHEAATELAAAQVRGPLGRWGGAMQKEAVG
jgi:hypothetical protein